MIRRVIAVAMMAVGIWSMGTGPTSAHDCSARITEFTDLGDPEVVKDCLRTGGNWGVAVGTVLVVTGAAVAATGLPRQTGGRAGPMVGELDPCATKLIHAGEISDLVQERERLQKKILEEWKHHADAGAELRKLYDKLDELEYELAKKRVAAGARNVAYLGLAALGIYHALALMGAAVVAKLRAAGVLAEVAAASGELAAGSAALTASQANTALLGAGAATGEAVVGPALDVLPEEVSEWLRSHDIDPDELKSYGEWGSEVLARLAADVSRVVSGYRRTATQFNLSFKRWAEERQAEFDQLNESLLRETQRWKQAQDACASAGGGEVAMPEKFSPSFMRIHVFEVPTTVTQPLIEHARKHPGTLVIGMGAVDTSTWYWARR